MSYSVQANTGGSRQGTLTIAGKTFTVTQEAPLTDLYLQNLTHTSGVWLYQATNSVVAENGVTIGGSASVTFQVGNLIRLGPGFQATAGSAATTFRTIIGP